MRASNTAVLIIIAKPDQRHVARIGLGRKTRGVCRGKLVFPGGKVEKSDRNIRARALKECQEETGITVPPHEGDKFVYIGVVTILRGAERITPFAIIHVFWYHAPSTCHLRGNGELVSLRWHNITRMPWKKMMPGDRHWFAHAIAAAQSGTRFKAKVRYTKDLRRVLRAECSPVI